MILRLRQKRQWDSDAEETRPEEDVLPAPSRSTDMIYVSPLSRVESSVAKFGVGHLVTLINGETLIPTPANILPNRHLKLAMNDICDPEDGLVVPCEHHVSELVQFAGSWDRKAPLLIHCWAGISRSTAAAFISLCALNEEGSEFELARVLRESVHSL